MSNLTTTRYRLTDCGWPTGVKIEDRKTMAVTMLEPQAAVELLTQAERLAGIGGLSHASADKAMNWLIESFV